MLYFIPAWYQQNKWCENEQYWHSRRMRSEFDDTVKHSQLFHRSKAYPFQIMLLSFAPNFRHFLHRQSVFHAPYWSCFDAIQEIRRKKIVTFSLHNLKWPPHIEFIYSPFVLVAQLYGEKYAQIEFGEDGNLIQIDMYQDGKISRRNIYDDRGFVSSTIKYEDEVPCYQDYLTQKGVWKIRHFFNDGHVEVNQKKTTYLLEYENREYLRQFSKRIYASMDEVIHEVLTAYLDLVKEEDIFCIAMHKLHTEILKDVLRDRKKILSFFENRYNILQNFDDIRMIESADYVITDSQETLKTVQSETGNKIEKIIDITPFDSRVDFGISQQLNVQKILVPVDGLLDEEFEVIVQRLGEYIPLNENARIHLFTRVADYDRKKRLLEQTRNYLQKAGMEPEWAVESAQGAMTENRLEADAVPVKFFVEQCVSELAVSKCIREQRVILDMRKTTELYLQITGISMGIPQIVCRKSQFVEHEKNGLVLSDANQIVDALTFYLDSITNWNEAMVYSYELGKKYTTIVLRDKWKEVIEFVGRDSGITTGE